MGSLMTTRAGMIFDNRLAQIATMGSSLTTFPGPRPNTPCDSIAIRVERATTGER